MQRKRDTTRAKYRQYLTSTSFLAMGTALVLLLNPTIGFSQVVIDNGDTQTVDGLGPDPRVVEFNDDLIIGQDGTNGRLVILNGGSVSSENVFLGNRGQSIGRVVIDGAGSKFATDGVVIIGQDRGRGEIEITNGAILESGDARIAREQGTTGSVIISGEGSAWMAGSLVHVGLQGTGSLTVSDGGEMHLAASADPTERRVLYLGAGSGGNGVLNIGAAEDRAATGAGRVGVDEVRFGEGGGRLVLNHTDDDYVLAADVVGNGRIDVLSGTTRLTGLGDYSGGTLINGGDAHLIGSTNNLKGTFENNGSLTFDQGFDATFDGEISGTGRLIKTGAGVLTIAADLQHSGGTRVEAGGLNVGADIGDVSVRNAVLTGDGSVRDLVLETGSVLAPGQSIGRIDARNADFSEGSVFEVEVNSDGQSDQLVASGRVGIEDNTTVRVRAIDPADTGAAYEIGTRYEIVSAGSVVTGRFANLEEDFAFLDGNLSYGSNTVSLTLVKNDLRLRDIAATQNQISTADGLEELGFDFAPYDAVIVLDEANARDAYDLLSGELHASLSTALIAENQTVRATSLRRLHQSPLLEGQDRGSAWTFWSEGYGAKASFDSDAVLDSDYASYGLLIGADTQVGQNWTVGILGGAGQSTLDVAGAESSADAQNFTLGAYAGGSFNNWSMRLGGSYSVHQIETSRDVNFVGFSEEINSDYDTQSAQVYAELGYVYVAGQTVIEPFAGLAYVHQKSDGFSEEGGTAALNSGSDDFGVGYASLGIRAETDVEYQGGRTATLFGSAMWERALDDAQPINVSFDGGSERSIEGWGISQDVGAVEFGVATALGDRSEIAVAVNGRFSDGDFAPSASASFSFNF